MYNDFPIDGCATFPQSPFGKPVGYSSIPHGGGIYPFNTVVNLTCNQPTFKPDPTPKSVKCLISSRWGDAVCFKTTPGDMGTKLVQGVVLVS